MTKHAGPPVSPAWRSSASLPSEGIIRNAADGADDAKQLFDNTKSTPHNHSIMIAALVDFVG